MTSDEAGWVAAHVETDDDFRRWEESPLRQVDFAVHIHYIREYIKRGDRVLEVGAGAGRFTRELAQVAGKIVVADISPAKLERNRRNALALDYADRIEGWCECDMCDLSPHFADGQFDAVVCYGGPLSYVFDRRDKAIAELVRVARPGGYLLLSAKSLWGTVHEYLPRILKVDPRLNREIVQSGDLGPETVAVANRFWHAYRAAEFRSFVEGAGTKVELMSASDCLSATWHELLSTWREDKRTWQHLLELEIEACREPGALDLGSHVLAIARKLG
jgi:ubiquinone/menaquinone biosynthesis C-methylase UbiE